MAQRVKNPGLKSAANRKIKEKPEAKPPEAFTMTLRSTKSTPAKSTSPPPTPGPKPKLTTPTKPIPLPKELTEEEGKEAKKKKLEEAKESQRKLDEEMKERERIRAEERRQKLAEEDAERIRALQASSSSASNPIMGAIRTSMSKKDLQNITEGLGKYAQANFPDDEDPWEGEGSGLAKHFKNYKIMTYKTGAGLLGEVVIDLPKLELGHKLEAYNRHNGKRVISQKTDGDFIDLITKRFDPKRKYSEKSKEHFRKLVHHSGLPKFKNSQKAKLLHPETDIIVGGSNEELLHHLTDLTKRRKTKATKNQMMGVMDHLLKAGALTHAQHKKIYEKYVQ